jgi:hypothetical protein
MEHAPRLQQKGPSECSDAVLSMKQKTAPTYILDIGMVSII